jgi:enoyl-[acyl-carrier-protein] reductase (NADH)
MDLRMSEAMTVLDPLPRVWDPDDRIGDMLKGRRGLVVGIANENSIAFGCAAKLRAFGADVAVTCLNERAEKHVRPLAETIDARLVLSLDVEVPGPIEASLRYAATELGPKGIRVFAISPGPLKTRAASGIAHFDELIAMAQSRAPAQRLVDIAEVGRVCAFLVGGASSGMTADTIYVDGGLHHVA